MPSITLKDIPVDLLDRLRASARTQRRSITQQALYLIEGGLSEAERGAGGPPREARDQVRRWRELAGRWKSSQSFEEEIESLMAARTEGRSVDL